MLQGQTALDNELKQIWSESPYSKILEQGVVLRQPRDETLIVRLRKICHESPARAPAIDLEGHREKYISDRKVRSSTTGLQTMTWFNHTRAQIMQQTQEFSFFMNLSSIVGRPLLAISLLFHNTLAP